MRSGECKDRGERAGFVLIRARVLEAVAIVLEVSALSWSEQVQATFEVGAFPGVGRCRPAWRARPRLKRHEARDPDIGRNFTGGEGEMLTYCEEVSN